MPNFTNLPLELREIVYAYYFLSLLYVYPEDQKLFAPSAPLLVTNTQIGSEALKTGWRIMTLEVNNLASSGNKWIDEQVDPFLNTRGTPDWEEKYEMLKKQYEEKALPFRRGKAMCRALGNMQEGTRKLDGKPLNARY